MAAEYEVNIKINTQQIERELGKVDKAVKNIGKAKGGSRASGLGLMPNDELKRLQQSKIYLGQSVQSIDRLAKIQDRRARSLNKINELESKGLNVHRLRRQLVKATTEQSKRRLGSAEKEFRILEKNLRLEQSKLRILREQRKGFPSSPIRGTRTMMGSPAQIAAAARAGGATSPIRGGLNFPGSPAFLAGATASRTPFGPSFPTGGASSPVRGGFNFPGSPIALAGATASRTPFGPSFPTGGAALPIRGSISMPGSPIAVQAAKATNLRAVKVETSWAKALGELQETAGMLKMKDTRIKQSWSTALAELNETASLLRVRSQQASAGLTGQSSPIGGATNIPGSPAFLRRQRRNKRLEQVGLGAGFPLLFGGGAGSVIGGGLGGLTGSFGAQIAFSAIGQQIDQFIASVAAVGTALTSASGTVEMFREKNLFSSDAVKEHAFQLEEQGKMQELATLLTKDLASQIGKNAVENFQALGGEVKEFLGIINRLFLSIQGLVAGPLAQFLSVVNSVLGGVSTDVQFGNLRGSLTGDAAAQFEAIVAETRGTRALTSKERQRALLANKSTAPVEGKLTTAVKEAVLKDPRVAKLRQTIDVTGQTTLDDTLGFRDTKGEKARREAAQLQKRLDRLEAERKKVLEISRFKDKIAAAEAADDKQLVIRLKGEQKIEEIEASRLKALAGVTNQRERDAINIQKATEKLVAHRTVERELGELQRARQEKFEDTIEDLDHQLALARATTDEERERLRIERQLALLKKGGMQDPELGEVRFKMEQLAQENTPLNQAIKGVREEINNLNDPIKHIIDLANTLGSAFSESFKGIISGSMTAREALANLFQRTADHFLDMAAQMIAAQIKMQILNIGLNFLGGFGGGGAGKAINTNSLNQIQQYSGIGANTNVSSLTSFLSPRANGGPVGAGRPYLVGERGPEMFIPGAQGNIVPNNAMGSTSIVVNVDASGSSVEGEAEQSRQLGKMLGAAVQAELIKQKRPGGLLAT